MEYDTFRDIIGVKWRATDIPNYTFFTNFPTGTKEEAIIATQKRFPMIPREAILVTPCDVSAHSIYVAVEFKPEVNNFFSELAEKLMIYIMLKPITERKPNSDYTS